jgi:peroxiredoxin
MLKRVLPKAFAFAAALVAFSLFAAIPRPLADVTIPIPNGKAVSLKSYRGKVLLVAMISTDCKTCIASIDILNHVQNDYGKQGFQVVAIAGDQNAQYMIGPFIQRYRPVFPMGFLSVGEMARLGDIKPDENHFAPIFMFVDRKGMVRDQVYGDNPLFKTEEASLRKMILEMLKQ